MKKVFIITLSIAFGANFAAVAQQNAKAKDNTTKTVQSKEKAGSEKVSTTSVAKKDTTTVVAKDSVANKTAKTATVTPPATNANTKDKNKKSSEKVAPKSEK